MKMNIYGAVLALIAVEHPQENATYYGKVRITGLQSLFHLWLICSKSYGFINSY